MICHNLRQLILDIIRVLGLTTNAGKNLRSLSQVALSNKVTRGLGQTEQTTSQDQGPGELEADWDTVGARVETVLSAVVDA